MASIPETLEMQDEDITATSTRTGSLKSTEGSNSNNLSSLSSIDDTADASEKQAPCLSFVEATSTAKSEKCPEVTATEDRLFDQATALRNFLISNFKMPSLHLA